MVDATELARRNASPPTAPSTPQVHTLAGKGTRFHARAGVPALSCDHACMSRQLTVRGVSDEVGRRLEDLSRERGQSMNTTVVEILEAA